MYMWKYEETGFFPWPAFLISDFQINPYLKYGLIIRIWSCEKISLINIFTGLGLKNYSVFSLIILNIKIFLNFWELKISNNWECNPCHAAGWHIHTPPVRLCIEREENMDLVSSKFHSEYLAFLLFLHPAGGSNPVR